MRSREDQQTKRHRLNPDISAFPFVMTRRVEFCHTDAGGIMHFARYFEFMEQAEHELLRQIGLSVMTPVSEGLLSWPRVSAKCDYQQPARFEDLLQIHLGISRIGNRSVTYHAEFWIDQQRIAVGSIVAACCLFAEDRPIRSIAIPTEIVAKLAKFKLPPATS